MLGPTTENLLIHDRSIVELAGAATRTQAASILMRFDQNVVEN